MSNRKMTELNVAAKQYRYAGDRGYGVPAQVAGEELDRIQAAHDGVLRTGDVVDEARPDTAPLHPAFEWDDEAAAEGYRQNQARRLIRAVVVAPQEEPDAEGHRAYYHVTAPGEAKPVYVSAEIVVQSPAMFADAVARLGRTLQQARSSVEELERLARDVGDEPERMARIALAMKAIEAAGAAVASLH